MIMQNLAFYGLGCIQGFDSPQLHHKLKFALEIGLFSFYKSNLATFMATNVIKVLYFC
jgi:hypothetical protein